MEQKALPLGARVCAIGCILGGTQRCVHYWLVYTNICADSSFFLDQKMRGNESTKIQMS
jgi:hypothetical protein